MLSKLFLLRKLSNQDLRKKLKEKDSKLIDIVQFGDMELILAKTDTTGLGLGVVYQVAIQRKGRDFTNIEEQYTKAPTGFEEHGAIDTFLENIVTTLNKWVSKYGRLYIASLNPQKTKKYVKILIAIGFNVEEIENNFFPIYYIEKPSSFTDF